MDYLLERSSTELIAAYLIRWPKKLEQHVGVLLNNDPATIIMERGLGAGEYGGKLTLLLKVEAGEAWWRALPQRLAQSALVEALRRIHAPALVDEPVDDGRLSDQRMVTLLNMRHERATDVLRRLSRGVAFSRAENESRGCFDTHSVGEITGRLATGEGSVLESLAVLEGKQRNLIGVEQQRQDVIAWANELKAAVTRLRRALVKASPGRASRTPNSSPEISHRLRVERRLTFGQLVGNLKRCAGFIDKCARDLPVMRRKVNVEPTGPERDLIRERLARIDAAADALLLVCSSRF